MGNTISAIEHIREKYAQLSSAEKKIADFILEDPQSASEMNVSGLASASGVSDATVVRMCRHLGYNGYHQFTVNLAEATGRSTRDRQEHEALLKEKDPAGKIFLDFASTMRQLAERIRTEDLRACADMIRGSSFVHIAAAGNAGSLSQYLHYRLERCGIRCTAELSPESFMNQVYLAAATDVILAISHSGSSRVIVDAAKLAREKGMKVIAITGFRRSPLTELADMTLFCGTRAETGSSYRNLSYLREMAVIDALTEFVMNGGSEGNDADVRLEELLGDTKF